MFLRNWLANKWNGTQSQPAKKDEKDPEKQAPVQAGSAMASHPVPVPSLESPENIILGKNSPPPGNRDQDALDIFQKVARRYLQQCDEMQKTIENRLDEILGDKSDTDAEAKEKKPARKNNNFIEGIFANIWKLIKAVTFPAHNNVHAMLMKEAAPHIAQLCKHIEEEHQKLQGDLPDAERREINAVICYLCIDIIIELKKMITNVQDEINICLKSVDLGMDAARRLIDIFALMIFNIPLSQLEKIFDLPLSQLAQMLRELYRDTLNTELSEEQREFAQIMAGARGEITHAMTEMDKQSKPSEAGLFGDKTAQPSATSKSVSANTGNDAYLLKHA